jgi:hypothetical protein
LEPNVFIGHALDGVQYPIRIFGPAGPSEPVRRPDASRRIQRRQLSSAAGFVLGAAILGFGAGYAAHATSGSGDGATTPDFAPAPGEFRLGPGNQMPPSLVAR